MRIFFAGIMHETAIASPVPTTLKSFEFQRWQPRETPSPPASVDLVGYGGGVATALARGHDVVLGLFTMAQPSAPLQRNAWQALKKELLDDLRAALPVDAVFLMLHGSQSAVGQDDCEGELLREVRAMAGPAVAVGVELDLHTNLSETMLSQATIIVACKQYPHTDYVERAAELVCILEETVAGQIKPVMAACRVPVLDMFPTTIAPMAGFTASLSAAERSPVLSVSALHGFTDTDQPDVGASVLVVADRNLKAAQNLANSLGREFLALALQKPPFAVGLSSAIDTMTHSTERFVIADVADNPGGGAAGDDTTLLRALLDAEVSDVACGMVWDPMVVDFAHAAGEGATLDLRIGGKIGPASGTPIDLRVDVVCVRNDICQAMFGHEPPNQSIGRSARLRIGTLDLIVNDSRQQVFSRHCFTGHGIDLSTKRVIAVKSTQHFALDFAPLVDRIIYCDVAGNFSPGRSASSHSRVRRPMYPIDPANSLLITEFSAHGFGVSAN